MGDGRPKSNKVSWPRNLVKKWLNIKNKAEDFQADDISFSDTSSKKSSHRGRRNKNDLDSSEVKEVNNCRIFVATWNVAGKSPPSYLNLEDWLHICPPADIYVLGFQEIVPLNAGNVLGTENNIPARKWLALIRKTLNNIPDHSVTCHTPSSPIPDPIYELDSDFEGGFARPNPSFLRHSPFHRMMDQDMAMLQPQFDHPRFSVCDRDMFGHTVNECDPGYGYFSCDDDNTMYDSPASNSQQFSPLSRSGSFVMDDRERKNEKSKYCLVASKQMVGIFLTLWVKTELRDKVKNLKVSCVGRGLMGYLGNKGSISISMFVHQTSFCFVCSHLTSGQKEGDEVRRNSDVLEILRKTRFPNVDETGNQTKSPQTILQHESSFVCLRSNNSTHYKTPFQASRVIWLGDLNYRIALSYRSAKALVEMRHWRSLLEKDQLRIEQRKGHVFKGWNEGKIHFPPTYKYSYNSDRYAGDERLPKAKRRTPAWCDRILWYGRGLEQLSYVRGESRFSDHRPVYSVFSAEIEPVNQNRTRKGSRIEVEELLS